MNSEGFYIKLGTKYNEHEWLGVGQFSSTYQLIERGIFYGQKL